MTDSQLLGLVVGVLVGLAALHWLVRSSLRLLLTALRSSPIHGASRWVQEHPLRAAFAERFPWWQQILAKRLSPRRFTGLRLTLLVLAAIYIAALFGGLVEELVKQQEVQFVDGRIQAIIAQYRDPRLVQFFLWLTALGSSPAVVASAVIGALFLWVHDRGRCAAGLMTTLLGAQITTWTSKYVLGRARPAFIDGVIEASPAFPSGHATAALAVYGFVAYALALEANGRMRFELPFWTVVLVTKIGFSRVFLSVHHASDVLGGFLVGAFWLLVGIAISETRHKGA